MTNLRLGMARYWLLHTWFYLSVDVISPLGHGKAGSFSFLLRCCCLVVIVYVFDHTVLRSWLHGPEGQDAALDTWFVSHHASFGPSLCDWCTISGNVRWPSVYRLTPFRPPTAALCLTGVFPFQTMSARLPWPLRRAPLSPKRASLPPPTAPGPRQIEWTIRTRCVSEYHTLASRRSSAHIWWCLTSG